MCYTDECSKNNERIYLLRNDGKRCCKSPLIESANTNIESEMSLSRSNGTFNARCFHE